MRPQSRRLVVKAMGKWNFDSVTSCGSGLGLGTSCGSGLGLGLGLEC